MNICIIGTTIPPVMGGLEVHVWELAKHLAKEEHNVHLIGYQNFQSQNFPKYEEKENVHIYRVINKSLPFVGYTTYYFSAAKKVLQLHKQNNFDIIHAHQAHPAGVAGAIVSYLKNIPLVITSHGAEILVSGKKLRYKPLLKFALKRASKVIGVSQELVGESIKCGARHEKTILLSNVVDIERFNPTIDGSQIRKRYNIPKGCVVVLSLRRLVPKTGVQYIIEAAKDVIKRYKNIKFLIVGDGILKERLIERTKELDIDDYFIFTGTIFNDEVPPYIAASDFSVFPSLAEATSIACLEVMACGKTVIVSNVGGLPEIVKDGYNGLIVNFEKTSSTYDDYGLTEEVINNLTKTIFKVISDKSLREDMGKNARNLTEEKHSWKNYTKRILEVYKGA